MESLLNKTAELLSSAAADPDRVLRWVLIYFGISSLGFMGVWLIGEIRRSRIWSMPFWIGKVSEPASTSRSKRTA